MADSSSNLRQHAQTVWRDRHYEVAATCYESLTESDQAVIADHWRLGLARLLLGYEEEAQLTWAMAMADGSPDELDAWAQELAEVLATEADLQIASNHQQDAFTIRYHLATLQPDNITNGLHLVQLGIALETLDDDILQTLVDRLQSAEPLAIDTDLFWATLQQLFTAIPLSPLVFELVKASLPRVGAVGQHWIDDILNHAVELHKKHSSPLGVRYAELCFEINPDYEMTLFRLSTMYQDEQRYEEGIALAKRYLEHCQTPVQRVIGNAIILRGVMSTGARWQDAIALLNHQTELLQTFVAKHQDAPGTQLDASIMCGPLFFYPYLGDTPETTRTLQHQVSKKFQDSIQSAVLQRPDQYYSPYPLAPHRPMTQGRKLRIGYISRCMRMHSVGWLSRWVFKHFDRDRFEVYAYFNQHHRIDAFTEEWFAKPATWAGCIEGDPLWIARQIQDHGIDILVDLDSITSDYTCSIMALKPAPIQVTWLGLDASGLPAIDYFLADAYVVPKEADRYYSEKIWRLPNSYIAVDGFEVGVPTLTRSHLGIPNDAVVYFSSQLAYKRYPETIRLQMQILKAVPNSYFLIKGRGDEAAIQGLFEQIAAEEGVSSDRLRFLKRDGNEFVHRANLGIADVVLDTYPYNGATTTMETLWMGIPIVTRVGQQFASRNSYTMMLHAGITEGIAHTPEEYVAWGVRFGTDLALRQQIHWRLRQSRYTSSLWNARQFTRELEQAYEQMWHRYLTANP